MLVTKTLKLSQILKWSGKFLIPLLAWASIVALLYHYTQSKWLTIPWLPIAALGTALAFYLGFKNNSAYDRMWEARKIWGAIVNSSRSWGTYIKAFVTNQFREGNMTDEELHQIRQRLIYRHIAWLYVLRHQLLKIAPWEHANQGGTVGKRADYYRQNYGLGLISDQISKEDVKALIPDDELEKLIKNQNVATQLIDYQSQDLVSLRADDLIDDFRHMELQRILADFYEHQGKTERIKKFPLPRQYASVSSTFVWIFIFLLPFGMISEFAKLGEQGIWLAIPFTALVGWIFLIMEMVGDYSENPFQGMANDIPMLSLCRTIEIDLREMLGETDLPPIIEPKNGVLM